MEVTLSPLRASASPTAAGSMWIARFPKVSTHAASRFARRAGTGTTVRSGASAAMERV